MRQICNSVKNRPLFLLGLIVGILLTAIAPVSAMPETTDSATNCENGSYDLIVLARNVPGTCPKNIEIQQGSAPPPGAIQINPSGRLPNDAVCEAPSNNACSQQGFACLSGKACTDTWNATTHQCMCQCK